MNHQQWAEIVQNLIDKIELEYASSSSKKREEWKKQLKQMKQTCDDLLISWATVEDSIAKVFQQYPDLFHDETNPIEEEFFLDESSLHQFRQGQGYYELAMFDSATPLLERLVQSEPDFLLGRVFLGLCYYQQKEWDEAKYHFELITKTATSNEFIGFAYHMLGCIELQVSKVKRAKKRFAKAISIIPENGDSWFNLAVCHYRLKQYQEAIPLFFQVLSLDGDDWKSMYYLSKCYHHSNQKENIAFWRLAALEKANHPQVVEAIAQDYEEQGKYEKAIDWYRRLLSQDRRERIVYRGMAWNYWMLRDSNQATCWLKKGLSLFPKDPYLLSLHLWMLLQLGKTNKAKDIIHFLPSQHTSTSIWNALLSRFFTQTGDIEQAIEIAEQLIKQEKEAISGLGHYQKGRILLETGETNQAIQSFQKARKTVSNWKDPIFYEGVCHLIQEQPSQTRDCWEKIDFYL